MCARSQSDSPFPVLQLDELPLPLLLPLDLLLDLPLHLAFVPWLNTILICWSCIVPSFGLRNRKTKIGRRLVLIGVGFFYVPRKTKIVTKIVTNIGRRRILVGFGFFHVPRR